MGEKNLPAGERFKRARRSASVSTEDAAKQFGFLDRGAVERREDGSMPLPPAWVRWALTEWGAPRELLSGLPGADFPSDEALERLARSLDALTTQLRRAGLTAPAAPGGDLPLVARGQVLQRLENLGRWLLDEAQAQTPPEGIPRGDSG
jgi:hypothetical protein